MSREALTLVLKPSSNDNKPKGNRTTLFLLAIIAVLVGAIAADLMGRL